MQRIWYKFLLLICKPYGWFLGITGKVLDKAIVWCERHGA